MLVYGKYECSSCRCCVFVACVHPVAVLNAAICMICSLLKVSHYLKNNDMLVCVLLDVIKG